MTSMKVLVDIGGTYVRFAVVEDHVPAQQCKYRVDEYESFEAALAQYCTEIGISENPALLISLAAHCHDDGLWRFVNRNEWVIDPARHEVAVILNDFEAATWGLIGLAAEDHTVLKEGDDRFAGHGKCLLGPGTGLGLGYLRDRQVQASLGGHMPAAALTEEQWMVLQAVQRVKDRKCIPVFEDVVSGPGLLNLYKAVCLISGRPSQAQRTAHVLENAGNADADAAIRLFHEFFGLCAANAVVTGDAYGGLYLMGGVFDRLCEAKLFDFACFEKFFVVDVVDSVRHALGATPVHHITEPNLSFKGLIKAGDA